jgi:drug/metabolite transporter (DMT)-like permease
MDTSSVVPQKQTERKWSYLLMGAGCLLLVTAFFIGISDNPPGLVLMLAGFFALVLGIIFRFAKWGRRKPAHQLLYWAPRALCIVIAVFLSMFALDVFGGDKGIWETTLALLIHLIPTYIVLIVLAVSWRWEWVGAAMFTALGVLYIVRRGEGFPGSLTRLYPDRYS